MAAIEQALLLVFGATAVGAVARRLSLPGPIVLVVLGVAVGLVPGVPRFVLDPAVALVLFLPPLLYRAAIDTSLRDFRANLRPIALLSVGLVLASTLVVGVVLHAVVPSLPLAAAFTLGAIVAPPDAVAATAVARRVGLPHRVVTLLEGESLLNDATALVAYRIAIAATLTGAFSAPEVLGRFLLASVGGTAIGLAVGLLVVALRRRLRDPLVENAVSLLTPYLAYLPAERLGSSGVLSVVVAGLVQARSGPLVISSTTRLQGQAVWEVIGFLLESVIFALIGLQLPSILGGLRGYSWGRLAVYALVVMLTVVVFRPVWIFPATYGPRLFPRVRAHDPFPPWQLPAVISWSGMRGVVSLAAAFALPLGFPQRDLLLFLTFAVIVATLVLQGVSLPWVIRRLGLAGSDEGPEHDQAVVLHNGARLALRRLDELVTSGETSDEYAAPLRRLLEGQARRAHAQLGPGADDEELPPGGGGVDGHRAPSAADVDTAVRTRAGVRSLRRELLAVERAEAVRLWQLGTVSDEALRNVQRDLDLQEEQLRD